MLRYVALGSSNKRIGLALHVTEDTVKAHMKAISHKLGASDRTHAVTLASRRGIIDLQYWIYALIKTNEFPRPVKDRWVSRWVREEISDWIRALVLKRQ